jgi:rod shape-determining protein MreC
MYTLRRWWDRHALQLVLVSLAVGAAWALRQAQGSAIFEVYQIITLPFQSNPTQAKQLSDARMLELQARVVELESQNQKLQKLLGYVAPAQSRRPIAAPVVGRSADQWWQQITLGRGTKAGIQVGFIVTAPGGLVGRIVSVTPKTSRVLLISDPTSVLGVTVSRSRYMGFLRGQSATQAVMQFFDKVPDVRRGDVVSTSLYSQIFPSGLPVGRVESVNLNKSPAPSALISLSAPLPYLEWVLVYPKERG